MIIKGRTFFIVITSRSFSDGRSNFNLWHDRPFDTFSLDCSFNSFTKVVNIVLFLTQPIGSEKLWNVGPRNWIRSRAIQWSGLMARASKLGLEQIRPTCDRPKDQALDSLGKRHYYDLREAHHLRRLKLKLGSGSKHKAWPISKLSWTNKVKNLGPETSITRLEPISLEKFFWPNLMKLTFVPRTDDSRDNKF